MSSSRHNARRAAIQALYQWDLTQQHADDIEDHFKQVHNMQNVDKRYLRLLLKEIPVHHTHLEQALQPFLDRDFSEIDPVERAILRVGSYELLFCKDVPPRVVLNETVELAKVFGSEHSYKFINGVMDKLAASLELTN